MCIQDILQIARDTAVTAASLVAILGINVWKREFKGKRDMELAEGVLRLFYQAEQAIEAIRFPIYYLGEGRTRQPEKDETPAQKEARDRAYVVFKKIKDHSDIFSKLHALRFRFMARFGKEKVKPFDEIKEIVDEIWVSAQELARLWERQSPSDEKQRRIKELEGVIWQGWGADTIKPRVDKNIQDIEKVCRPIIEGKGSRWRCALQRQK